MSRCSTSTPVSRLWTGRLETVASATASTPPDTTDVSADIRAVKLPVRFSDLSLPAVKANSRLKEHGGCKHLLWAFGKLALAQQLYW